MSAVLLSAVVCRICILPLIRLSFSLPFRSFGIVPNAPMMIVQSKITPLYTPLLIYEGKSVTLKCDDTSWSWNGARITDCSGCPSNCKIEDYFKGRVEATCENNETFLRFISTKVADEGKLRCPESDTASFPFLVGRNGPLFYSGNGKSYALNNTDYTLICDGVAYMIWYNQKGEQIGYFSECQNYKQNKYTQHFSCSNNNNKYIRMLDLKKVTVEKDDGKIFGCKNLDGLFLFTLKINVAVESVSIQAKKQYFIENENGTFQCIVEKSKPKPSFKWEYVLKSGLTMNIPNSSDKHELVNGKFWKTTSTIKLKLTRELSQIRCGARIEDMPYVIKTIKPNILYSDAPEKINFHIIFYIVIGILIFINLVLIFIIFCLFAKNKQIKNNFINKKGEENETYEEIKTKINNLDQAQSTTNNDNETYDEINDTSIYSHKVQITNNNINKNPQSGFPSKAKLEAKQIKDEYENLGIKPQQVEGKELPYNNVEYIAVIE